MDDRDLPDFGDLAGLAALYWQTVRHLRRADMPDDERVARLTHVVDAFRAAVDTGSRRVPATI